ncbi:hypothetical protein GCM10027403_01870 [Arthrobacter tecti]
MRRLTPKDEERGAVSVLAAFLMVVLLAFAALAVDIGLLYAEKAQLQNGADAAALSIAQACADDELATSCSNKSSLAKGFADLNALDDRSAVKLPIALDLGEQAVTVETRSSEAGRTDNRVSLFFARVLGITDAEVTARASAAWGSPVSGPAPFPVVFSKCEVQEIDSLQLVQFYGNNSKDQPPPGCAGGPPGGFGHLDTVPGKCEAFVDISEAASGSDPGNGTISDPCQTLLKEWAASIESGVYPLGLFPIYKTVSFGGNNATYGLSGFAAFEIYGWKLRQGNSNKYPESFREDHYDGFECSKDCIGIIGKFVEHVSLEDAYTLGSGSADYGTDIVKLTLEEEETP